MVDRPERAAIRSADTELASALEREKALRNILDAINDSTKDDTSIFDVILHHARQLCDAPVAALMLAGPDDPFQKAVAHFGASEATAELYRSGKVPVDPEQSIVARAICSGDTVQVADILDTDTYRRGVPVAVTTAEDSQVRTILAVPMRRDGAVIGAFSLMRKEVREFTSDQISLLETFAAQAVIAIENTRQFRELEVRLEREAATREILQVISQSRSDDFPVFETILRLAAELCDAPTAGLQLVNADRTHFSYACKWGVDRQTFQFGESWSLDSPLMVPTAIREARVVHNKDITSDPIYLSGDPVRKRLVEEGIRSYLVVPLLRNGQAIGSITLSRREIRGFSEGEIALVETFAAQAVIAIENVQQFRELQARLAREAATRRILEVISQSREDEMPVFEAIVENAARLSGAAMSSLNILDTGKRHLTIRAHWGEALKELSVDGTVWPLDGPSIPAQCAREARVIQVEDLAGTDSYRDGDPVRRQAVDVEGIRTFLAVPLLFHGKAIGCIALYRREVHRFSDSDVDLVRTFAEQAVIAIENVRQFREVQSRLEREAASREILQVISQSRDDDMPVFRAILEQAERLCGAWGSGLQLLNDAGSHLRICASKGGDGGSFPSGTEFDLREDIGMCLAVREKRVVHFEDLKNTDLYRQGHEGRRKLVDVEGMRTHLNVPLIKDGVAFGNITLGRREQKPFTPDEIALVEGFAAQAVIAIENVRQFKALESLNAELGDRVEAQVGEIERMGRLKRFLPSAVVDRVISQGSDKLLASHRALLGVLFCDIRGFTAFCETAEPEETIEVLQTYHREMGALIAEHGAGVDTRAGDGIMVLFNDPLPCDDPAGDALRLGLAMHARMRALCSAWRRHGHKLGFGVGISLGYATVGMVGSEGRYDYTASGTAVNLAARLCDRAADGEILLSPRAYASVDHAFVAESVGALSLKGIHAPVEVFRVVGARPSDPGASA